MRYAILIAAFATASALTACGDTRAQRVVTGAAGGAVAGEVIADRPIEGAVAGGVIGGLVR